MYEPTAYRYPFGPSPVGLGQTCPSLEQLMGITDCTDACQASSPSCTPGQQGVCYNTATGANVTCPVSGSIQTTSPAGTGPLGTMTVSNLNWGVLAAVALGLVAFVALAGGR